MTKKAKADKAKEAEAGDEARQTPAAEAPAAPEDQTAPPMLVNAQYIKDLSFEAPATPGVFAEMQEKAPDISINLDVTAKPLEDKVFEVLLHIKADCKAGETVAFILELVYGGIFTLNVQPEHQQAMLLIEGPRLLFPFVRYILADVSRDGGFPPLLLGPVDFAQLFHDRLAEQQKEAASAQGSPAQTS